MKHIYVGILFLIYGFAMAKDNTAAVVPSATISGGTTVCQNAASPLVTFTGSGGTAPYTFTYTRTGLTGNQIITTTGTNNSISISAPTGAAGTFTYSLVSVSDSSDPPATQNVSGTAIVTINPQANASINSSADSVTINGFTVFRICENQPSQFEFYNASTTISTNTSYSINWGDGTPSFTGSSWSTLNHTFQVGLWNLTYTVTAQNGCNNTKIFKVFVGNNPAVGLGNPGNTDICISSSLTFPITGTENNPPGTTYNVSFNDGSPNVVFNHPPPTSVTHTFLINSCGTSSTSGTTTYQNSFFASIQASNPCDQSSASVVPIRISTPPVANFTQPQTIVCAGTQICFTNSSTGGVVSTTSSCSSPKLIWSISPNTGFALASGLLGDDFGNTNTNAWTTGSSSICPIFSIPGNYIITLKIGNRCGIDTITKTICVQPLLTPQFTLNTISGCTPLSVTATNTTVLTNQCATPTYLWTVGYSPEFCGTAPVTIPSQSTANANFNFTVSGTYTITLATTNSCGTTTNSQTVIVKKPPTVSIATIPSSCGTANITPTATVNSCAPSSSTLTYAWSFPGGIPSTANTANPGIINYPNLGSYTVSLTVSNECGSTSATQNFSVNTTPVITNSNLSQTICSGSATTPFTLLANPVGTTFSWTATATTGLTGFIASGISDTIPSQTITTTNSNPGTVTYVITPTFNGCAGPTVNYVIAINPAPTITAQPTSSNVCIGGIATTLSITLGSSAVSPAYQWYSNTNTTGVGGILIPGATNASYNPSVLTSGIFYYYCIISFSSGGCSILTSNTAIVVVNPLPIISTQPQATQNICVGGSITPLTASFTGGTGTPTYQWYSNNTNSNTGGTIITGATSAAYALPIFNAVGSFYYYVVISFTGNGCGAVSSNTAEVIVLPDPTITVQPLATQTLCQGETPTILEVIVSGGISSFNYQWYSNTINNNTNGIIISSATTSIFTPPTSTLGTMYYYCIISQNSPGCSVTSVAASVIINQSPFIVNQPVSSSVCVGGIPTLLSFTFTNGLGTPTYQWYFNTTNNTATGTLINGETNATFTPPSSIVGTIYYYCLVTFSNITGSCATITTNTAEVNIIPASTIDQNPLPNQSLCVGATIPNPLNVTFTGGTGIPNYQWFSNNTNSNTGGNLISGATTQSYTPAVFTTAGNFYYYVEISFSGNGCGSIISDAATVSVIADPVISSQPLLTQTICQNSLANTISVAASGGIGSLYTFQWYSSTSTNTSTGTLILGETNSTFIPPTTSTGTMYYYCVINQTNGNGCNVTSNAAAVIISPAPIITIQPLANIWCIDQVPTNLTIDYTNGTGTPTYQWFSNTIDSNSGGISISGATNATYPPPTTNVGSLYYYCVINFPSLSGGCETIISVTALITVNQNPIIAPESTTICSNNPFTIAPVNGGSNIVPLGTTYTWSTPTIIPAGAISGAVAELTPQNQISQILNNSTTSPATVIYSVTPTSGLCAGSNFTIIITVNPAIDPNVVAFNNTCFGANNATIATNIIGGMPPYIINWSGPNGFSSASPAIINIAPGIYDLTINDTGNCPYTNSYTITEPDDIIITIDSENDITCFGNANGSINISVSGGTGNFSYSWTKDTTPFSNNEDISNLNPGTYVVSVTDANNCGPKTETFTISQPQILTANLVNQTSVDCYGAATGAITINVTGGTPNEISTGVFEYNFSWTGPNGFISTNQNLSNIVAGTYNVSITDSQGCTDNLTVIISESTEIIISYTTTPITCYGANDASFSTTITGGNPPYQFQWNNLSTALNQNNLSAGTYIITVRDNLGCVKTQSIVIPEAPIFTVNPIVNNISCYGANNGSINLNLTGGIAPVALTWSDGSTAGLIRNNLAPGTYTATISDGTPCFIVRTFTIIQPQPLVISAIIANPLNCSNANSGAINLIVSGGTPTFNYSWSNGAITEDLTNLTAGNYQITVTDANGCSATKQFSLVRPAPIVLNVSTQTDFNCATRQITQNFVAQASGGVPPFQYQWSSGNVSGANNNIMNSNTNGTVIVTVTDNIGCTASYTVDVDNPVIGSADFEVTSFGYTSYGIYSINDPIQFQSNITGDYISVSWDFGDGAFSTELNPIHTYTIPKNYIVTQTVTYPFGCVYVQTISLLVEKGYLLVVPTAFTPNNDNLNDTFRPVTKRLTNVRLDIYDTWGSLIYSETGDVLVGWDGKIKGFNAENGNYYAKVQAETFYGTIIFDNQTFVLIK
jgi:gliding motility-associated-like protein